MPKRSRSETREQSAPAAVDPDVVIEGLAALAEAGTSPSDFFGRLLQDLLRATAGLGAALWVSTGDRLQVAAQQGLAYPAEPAEADRIRLGKIVAGGQCRTFRCDSDANALEILCPWRLDAEEHGVLELRQVARISEAALAGQERFVNVVAELVASYHRCRRMAIAGRREEQWRQIDRFSQAVHRSADLEETAYEIANEGRSLVECDRVTVVVRRRGRWTVVAVSGSDNVNRRSPLVSQLELLAGLIAVQRRAVWSGLETGEPPAELEDSLDEYHDLGSARVAAFLPLLPVSVGPEDDEPKDAEPRALLVFECFDRANSTDMRELCDAVCRHSTSALHLALQHEEMPLRRLSSVLERSRSLTRLRQQPWKVVLAIAASVLLVVLAVIPADLRVEATGTLMPQTRRHLFAPADAVVERLLVREAGRQVRRDEELIVLRDSQLQFETERILGDLETARKQLAGIEAERLHADRASRNDLREAALRSAEEEALKKQIEGLRRQQAILDERREKLHVRSPMDGQLLTWNPEELLQSRPVGRGQILLTVADLGGAWTVELEIPDDRIADVADAIRSQDRPLTAQFILATAPETRYSGTLEELAPATDVRDSRGPTVFAVVRPDDQEAMRSLRPGASVVAKIHCGRRSLLYVMSRGLLRTIRSRILF